MVHVKDLEKDEQIKPKISRGKEIIKTNEEMKSQEVQKTLKQLIFETDKQLHNFLLGYLRKETEDPNKMRGEERDFTTQRNARFHQGLF